MRPAWKGYLKIDLVSIPVQIFTAHTGQKAMRFDLLHRQCKTKIAEQFFCPVCDRTVGSDELAKGFECEKGACVLDSDEDFKAAKNETSRTVEIIRFVNEAQVDPVFFCHWYYLVPSGKSAIEAFALFLQAMADEKKIALATAVIGNKEHLLAIRPHDGELVAFTLHHPEEISSPEEVKEAGKVKAARIDQQNLRLAKSLIRKTTGEFDIEDLSGEHGKTLVEIMRGKGRDEPASAKVPEKQKRLSLIDALEQSIERVGKSNLKVRRSRKQEPAARPKTARTSLEGGRMS